MNVPVENGGYSVYICVDMPHAKLNLYGHQSPKENTKAQMTCTFTNHKAAESVRLRSKAKRSTLWD